MQIISLALVLMELTLLTINHLHLWLSRFFSLVAKTRAACDVVKEKVYSGRGHDFIALLGQANFELSVKYFA